MKMRFNQLNQIFHAQLGADLLSVQVERWSSFDVQILSLGDILQNPALNRR